MTHLGKATTMNVVVVSVVAVCAGWKGKMMMNDCRDFTYEELIDYNESIDKLFKPTGINIFDEREDEDE